MGEPGDEELQLLRQRAYGPGADIHADPVALERLRQLEEARAPHRTPVEAPAPAASAAAEPASARAGQRPELAEEFDRVLAPQPPTQAPPSRALRIARWMTRSARTLGHRVARARRSSVVLVLGLTLAVATLITVLVVVQRVQTDPLQVGAQQIARLTVDPDYDISEFFTQRPDAGTVLGFQEFHGLRAVMTAGGFYGDGGESCIVLFRATDGDSSSAGSFSGMLMSGCAAGGFPAMTQFPIDLEPLPAELQSALAGYSGLQFVYDAENREVVVFATE